MNLPTIVPEWLSNPTDVNDTVDDIVPMTADNAYPEFFPGYVGMEGEHNPNESYLGTLPASQSMDANGNAFVDRVSFGEMGEVDRNAYSIYGPVDPGLVENFELTGEVSAYHRPLDFASGPVGAYDHASYTSMQIAQQMSPESYTEASLVSLLTEGI